MVATYYLAASPDTVRTGSFCADYPPVLSIASGDTVTVECLSGYKGEVGQSGFPLPPALQALHDAGRPQLGPHLVTGPIAVADALPGDMLEIKIDAIEFGADWGWCGIFPLLGTIPEDFPQLDISFVPIDRECRLAMLPWGPKIPLSPFFGVMGVAPAPVYGELSSKEPRAHGGNLDNKELVAGSTLFLPVFVPGANFSAGDGHGVQGDGEVCVNALEMCLTGTFTFTLHKAVNKAPLLQFPRAESPTHFISMGMDKDLDIAVKHALREMIDFICNRTTMSRVEAYKTCSLAVDFHVTQTVNGEVGVHGMLKKGLLF
jgi:acetamidase/formamidase